MTLATLTTLLGWVSLINVTVLIFSTIALMLAGKPITKIHSSLFNLDKKDLNRAYFQYLAQYKIAILIFNLSPYLALKLMAH